MRLSLGRAVFATLGGLLVGWSLMRRSGQSPRSGRARRPSPEQAADLYRAPAPAPAEAVVYRPRKALTALVVVLLAVGAGYAGYGYKSSRDREREAARLTGGDPHRGPVNFARYGCAGCHTIPGIPGADGLVGPPLSSMPRRVYVGGVLRNTPDNLVRWIVNPRAINPETAMPVTGISPEEARDVVAYLYARG